VSPFWFEMGPRGTIDRNDHNDDVARLIRTAGRKLVPTVKNGANGAAFHDLLADPGTRQTALAAIERLVFDRGYDGIHIDFELLLPGDRPHLTAFMADLRGRLAPRGKLVTQAVQGRDRERPDLASGAFDFAALAQHNDLIVLMSYGFKSAGSASPGSTAPLSWVDATVVHATSQIPPAKLLLGVPYYGFDWNTAAGPPATALRHDQAVALARQHGAGIGYDNDAQGATFAYWSGGQRHEVWFEDRRSAAAKVDLAMRRGLAGVAGWRLGQEDPEVWSLFRRLPPPEGGPSRWLLAEGSTGRPYETWYLVANPQNEPATVTATYMFEGRAPQQRQYTLRPQSRLSVFANADLPIGALSAALASDRPVYVERAVYFGHDGHASGAVASASPTWYLPEGFTGEGFHTWLLLLNPNSAPVDADLLFLRQSGEPLHRRVRLSPQSRLNVFANQVLPNESFATVVTATAPIVVERSSYFDGGRGGHSSMGASATATNWYFAEGFTGHSTWFLFLNPGDQPATARLTLLGESGAEQAFYVPVPPRHRATFQVPDALFGTERASFAAVVEADRPIVAERAAYWNEGRSGHSSIGSPTLARAWMLPEGSTAPPFQEWVLVANPSGQPARLTFTFLPEGGEPIVRTSTAPPRSRFTLWANQQLPNVALSIRVESDQPIAVERSMYFGRGGHNSPGFPLP
ncbi:MAG: hypothetical protein HYY05_02110, partial [Chloroflexi bacterium]|nr:hypothetical protein [Chloroflexota bacterium]